MSSIRKGAVAGATTLLVAALTLIGVDAAIAASGTKLCNVPKSALLTTDAKSTGSVRFTNHNNATQSYTFYIPGGFSQHSSAYTNTDWTATASGGFYSPPSAVCY